MAVLGGKFGDFPPLNLLLTHSCVNRVHLWWKGHIYELRIYDLQPLSCPNIPFITPLKSPLFMAEKSLICMVSLGEKAVFSMVTSSTSFFELKFDVAERLKVPYDALSMVYKSERNPDLSFEIENGDDLKCMVEHTRNIGCPEIHIRATIDVDISKSQNTQKEPPETGMNALRSQFIDCTPAASHSSERIPNDNPSGGNIMRSDDIINNTVMIPAWWHTALTEEGQEFESADELRLALTYYSIVKMFDMNL